MDCTEFLTTPVSSEEGFSAEELLEDSVGGPGLSAAQRGSLEDSTALPFSLRISLYL